MWWLVAMAAASGLDDARRLEREGRFAAALAAAEPCAVADTRCASLRDRLLARQDPDGSFVGWGELQAVRASLRTDGPQVTRPRVEALLDRDLSAATEAEARLWLADQALRGQDPQAAVDVLEPVGEVGEEGLDRRVALLRSRALARAGRWAEADVVEADVRANGPRRSPVQELAVEARRRTTSGAALAVLAGFGLVSLPALPRAERRVSAGLPWLLLGLVPMLGIAWAWEASLLALCGWLGAGFVAVHLVSALALSGARSSSHRTAVRLLAAGATVAVLWLALWGTSNTAWVGL